MTERHITHRGKQIVVPDHTLMGDVDPSSSDLTTLAAVKAFLKKTGDSGADDDELQELITSASSVITKYCRRQFVPDAGNPVTHRFRSSSRIIPFRNFDLQAAATVTLNPQSTSPQVLTEWTDYELLPLDGDELLGTYTYIKLLRHCWNRGHFIVDIDGTWGAATIPPDVAKACDVTVAEWFRSKVAAFSTVFNDEGVHVVPAPLPTMVCGWLEPYRRVVPFL